jgi:hypothetical protein
MKGLPSNPIQFIRMLNGARGWHGNQYRSLCGKWLAQYDKIASTQEESPTEEDQMIAKGAKDSLLKARRARLLERIEELELCQMDQPMNEAFDAPLQDLRDELQAVESALGWPEPKEPQEADRIIDCPISSPNHPSAASNPSKAYCPTCLCLLNHEDPSQSCQCDG